MKRFSLNSNCFFTLLSLGSIYDHETWWFKAKKSEIKKKHLQTKRFLTFVTKTAKANSEKQQQRFEKQQVF